MSFEKPQMQYDDGYYKWQAAADHDNPYYKKGADHSELNRTEGYEILYYINHLANRFWDGQQSIALYHKLETAIRYTVPKDRRTHRRIEEWLLANWSKI